MNSFPYYAKKAVNEILDKSRMTGKKIMNPKIALPTWEQDDDITDDDFTDRAYPGPAG